MSLAHLQADLAAHLASRPELPRPVPPVASPEWQAFRVQMEAWLATKARLESKLTAETAGITFERTAPRPTAASDYYYREPRKRRVA